jgi:tetratricopeptide (TPR) repeat protein
MIESPEQLDKIGINRYHAGAIRESVQWIALAIEEAEKGGEQEIEFMARGHLSEAYIKVGEFRQAIEAATVLLTRARRAEDPKHSMRAMSLLAIGIEKQNLRGRWDQFRKLVHEALDIARTLHSDGYWEVQNLETLGTGYIRMREFGPALHWLQTALNALRRETFEAVFFRTRIFQNLADLARLRGNCREAKFYVQAAFDIAQENTEHTPHLLCGLGIALARILRTQGDLLEALDLVEQNLGAALRSHWRYEEQLCERLRCEIQLDLRRGAVAGHAAERALRLAIDMGMIEERIECLLNAGRAHQLCGDYHAAHQCFEEASKLAREAAFEDHIATARLCARGVGKPVVEN